MRTAGMTFESIGAHFGFTRAMAYKIWSGGPPQKMGRPKGRKDSVKRRPGSGRIRQAHVQSDDAVKVADMTDSKNVV